MAKEIERKFLVVDKSYKSLAQACEDIRQGYLSLRKEATVRIRIKGAKAFLTIKGLNSGAIRDEWEYEVPVDDANDMLNRLSEGKIIEKKRYIVDWQGFKWEIDEFYGCHAGLVVAEIELNSEHETFPLPPFVGLEVTGDVAYYNSTLAGM